VEVIGVIDADYVRKRLEYDPDTGVFIWKPRDVRRTEDKIWNARFSGEVAGTILNTGYRRIGIDGKYYGAARLAWLYVHGEWPKNEIDHINRVRDDDRLVNLRDVTHTDNQNNRKSNNGLPEGVYWCNKRKKYIAQLPHRCFEFKYLYLAQFDEPIAAGEAVQKGLEIVCNTKDMKTIKELLEKLQETYKPRGGLPKGVSYRKTAGKFAAQLYRDGKMVYLGSFNTPEEASEAYLLAKG
jgi:hypothetical protein